MPGTSVARRKPRRKTSEAKKAERQAMWDGIDAATEDTDPEDLAAAFVARWGSRYGEANLLRLWVQCPHATQLHKYETWVKMGRQPRKGSAAIWLRIPRTRRDDEKVTETNPDGTVFTGAAWTPFFDFSQTADGDPDYQEGPADADPQLVALAKKLRAEALASHPENGGTVEDFTAAWDRYEAVRNQINGYGPKNAGTVNPEQYA